MEKMTKEKSDDSKESRHFLENIMLSTIRLSELVEDLLEVSRVEQNRLPIKMQPISVNEIVKPIAEEMKISAQKKNLKLNYKGEKSKVMADPARLKQIIVNIIGNSIKYTSSGSISVSVKEKRNDVFITVADSGIGMSSENMKDLFSKFYRVKNDKTKDIPGTGLGLWISREIARKMDGDIYVESIEGVGSHFTLKLKKA
jgi:two-component system phosphate regulon sensor histidine kinase PhoR